MKIPKNLKNEGILRRNYKHIGGVEVRYILHSYGLLSSCQIVKWDRQNVKRSSLKNKIGMGYVKIHGFHDNPLYESQDWG